MPCFLSATLAALIVFLARLLARFVPDRGFVLCLGALRALVRDAQTRTVLRDAQRLFQNRTSARIARRILRESRPAQLRAIVRGALR